MPRSAPQPDPEDLHKDLMATMAASRELGPEMDKALVDSYMERHPELKGQPNQQALMAPQSTNKPDIVGLTGMGVGMIGYVTLLIVTKGELWWMFWPMMGWAGWRWGSGGRHGEHHEARQQLRDARYQARVERRMNRYGVPYVRVSQPEEPTPEQPAAIPPTAPVAAPPLPPTPTATAPTGEAPVHTPSSFPPINPAG
jgi:hypothetical protein